MSFFHVVDFPDENSSGIIPDNWYIPETEMTYYPPKKKKLFYSYYVKKRSPPAPDWVKWRCRILRTYDNYDKALAGDRKAQDTSDLASAPEVSEPQRKPKRYKKFTTSSSSASSNDMEYDSDTLRYPGPSTEDLETLRQYNDNYERVPVVGLDIQADCISDLESVTDEPSEPKRKCTESDRIIGSDLDILELECEAYTFQLDSPLTEKDKSSRHSKVSSKPKPSRPKLPTKDSSNPEKIKSYSVRRMSPRKLSAMKQSVKPLSSKETVTRLPNPSQNPAHHKPQSVMQKSSSTTRLNHGASLLPSSDRVRLDFTSNASTSSIAAPLAPLAPVEREIDPSLQNITLQDVYRKSVENKRLLVNLTKELHWIKTSIQKVLNVHDQDQHPVQPSPEVVQLSALLPMRTVKEMEEFETILTNEKQLFSKLVQELRILGGQSCGEATRRMLKHLIVDELSAKYTYFGTTTKRKLANLEIVTALKQAIRSIPVLKDTDNKKIEGVIKEWFRHAPQRLSKHQNK